MLAASAHAAPRHRDRRRPARSGGGARTAPTRHERHGRAYREASDGASARRARGGAAAHRIRAARNQIQDARRELRKSWGGTRVSGVRLGRWPRGRRRPGGHRRRSPPQHRAGAALRDCIAIAACSWTTRCSPTTRRSMPWASACSTAAEPSALVAPLFDQARVCAAYLAERAVRGYRGRNRSPPR